MSWVNTAGGVKRWDGDRPIDSDEPDTCRRPSIAERRTRECADCGVPIHRGSTRCLRHAVQANYGKPRTPHATLGVICDDCGCLCLPDERCPLCLAWAIRDAIYTSWATATYYERTAA